MQGVNHLVGGRNRKILREQMNGSRDVTSKRRNDEVPLELVSMKAMPTGIIFTHYKVDGPLKTK
jgi:hypothetical protein